MAVIVLAGLAAAMHNLVRVHPAPIASKRLIPTDVTHVTFKPDATVAFGDSAQVSQVTVKRNGKIPLVVFTQPGCGGCVEFNKFEVQGGFPEADIIYVRRDQNTGWKFDNPQLAAEFERTIPIGAVQPGMGPRGTRPADPDQFGCPAFWIPGSKVYWSGFTPEVAGNLRGWMIHTSSGMQGPPQASFQMQAGQTNVSAIINASPKRFHREGDPLYQSALPPPSPAPQHPPQPAPQAEQIQPEEQLFPEDFTGVCIIITVEELLDVAPSLRRSISDRGDRSLKELVNKHFGDRVQARLVTEVAKPSLYGAIQDAAGTTGDKKVAIHVLVPEKKQGLIKGFILSKIQSMLAEHVMPQIQQFPLADVNIVLQRIHGGAYEQLFEVVQHPPDEDKPIDGKLPSGTSENLLVALVTRHLRIIEKIRYFWPWKSKEAT